MPQRMLATYPFASSAPLGPSLPTGSDAWSGFSLRSAPSDCWVAMTAIRWLRNLGAMRHQIGWGRCQLAMHVTIADRKSRVRSQDGYKSQGISRKDLQVAKSRCR
jgi:hypothetical protein